MTIMRTTMLAAVLVAGVSTAAMAGTSNNASAGNDRTTTTQYSRTMLPIGGTMGETNRWDVSYWTGVTTKVASKPDNDMKYGFNDNDYYARGMYYPHSGRSYYGDQRGW